MPRRVDGAEVEWRVVRARQVAAAVALIGGTVVAVTALGLGPHVAAVWAPDRIEPVSPQEVAALVSPSP